MKRLLIVIVICIIAAVFYFYGGSGKGKLLKPQEGQRYWFCLTAEDGKGHYHIVWHSQLSPELADRRLAELIKGETVLGEAVVFKDGLYHKR